MTTPAFDRAVELATGESIQSLRDTPIDVRRNAIEKATGRVMQFASAFPLIGRGNVLRDRFVTHIDAETAYRYAIRDE